MTTKPSPRRRGPTPKLPDPLVLAGRLDEVLREIAASPVEEILASQHIAERPALYDSLFARSRGALEVIRKLREAWPAMPVADVEALVARAEQDVLRRAGKVGSPTATPGSTHPTTTAPASRPGPDPKQGEESQKESDESQAASRDDGAGSDADPGGKNDRAEAAAKKASTKSIQSEENGQHHAPDQERRDLIGEGSAGISEHKLQPTTAEALMQALADSQAGRRIASAAGAPSMESAPYKRVANVEANQGGLPAEQAVRTVTPEHPSQPATSGHGQPRELAGRPAFSLMQNGLQGEGGARMQANHGRGIDRSSPAHAGQAPAQSSTEKPAEGSGTS